MRKGIIKNMNKNQLVEVIYISNSGQITKRRVKVYKVNQQSFIGYCYLRKSIRTFNIANVFALVPVTYKERMVI